MEAVGERSSAVWRRAGWSGAVAGEGRSGDDKDEDAKTEDADVAFKTMDNDAAEDADCKNSVVRLPEGRILLFLSRGRGEFSYQGKGRRGGPNHFQINSNH